MKPHKIYGPIDGKTRNQFFEALKADFAVKGALMADAHPSTAGLPVGGVIATEGVVVPSWVGVDAGCGVLAVPTTFEAAAIRQNAQSIFAAIYDVIPTGFSHNKTMLDDMEWGADKLPKTKMLTDFYQEKGYLQAGSAGGGNHYLDLSKDEDDRVWICVHSGSRGIGHTVGIHYMKRASGVGKAQEGNHGLRVDSSDGLEFITDMNFCLAFALANRKVMASRIGQVASRVTEGKILWDEMINRHHNHAEFHPKTNTWIHRKGATHAEWGMKGVIPGNMRDGSFIVTGKGNPDSLWSSSHGAGRVMGRKEAKEKLDMAAFKESMQGIVAKVEKATLDEAPDAYKNIWQVIEEQADLITVDHHLQTMINIKA